MDYTIESLQFQLNSEREYSRILFEQMERESSFMMRCIENMVVITEAEEVSKTNNEEKKGFFQRIIDFIRKLFGIFEEKVIKVVNRDKQWLEDNSEKLQSMDYSGIEIEEIIPFWQYDVTKMANDFTNRLNKAKEIPAIYSKMDGGDNKAIHKKYFSDFYADDQQPIADGFKNKFRTGKPETPKYVSLSGEELKNKVLNTFKPYCMSYRQEIKSKINDLSDKLISNIQLITKELERRKSVSESYCLLEGLTFNESLICMENYSVLLEEKTEADNNSSEKSDNENDSKKNEDKINPTSIKVSKSKSKEEMDTKNKLKNKGDTKLKAMQTYYGIMQTMLSAIYTVAEETYTVYINVMKKIVESD